MTTFYSEQLEKLSNSNAPLPAIKLKDSKGVITEWMHLTPECVYAIELYIKKVTKIYQTDSINL